MHDRIEIVCHRNQVRSPFLCAFLRKHFQELDLRSSGISPLRHSRFDSRAIKIASEWGFSYQQRESSETVNTGDQGFFLAVDMEIRRYLHVDLGIDSLIPPMTESIENSEFLPKDPINCGESEFKSELAKLLVYGVARVKSFIDKSNNPQITCFIPRRETSFPEVLRMLKLESYDEKLAIVDSCFKSPNIEILSALNRPIRKPMHSLEMGTVFASEFEILSPEKLLCSDDWRDWLTNLSHLGRVILLAPPMETVYGEPIWDSYLAAIWAHKIVVV